MRTVRALLFLSITVAILSYLRHRFLSSVPTMTKGDRSKWLHELASLPAKPSKMPVFFFAHGSPVLAFSGDAANSTEPFVQYAGPNGPCAQFLKDFGKELVNKYDPKGIVVFSAHWESKERLVTDYGDENPLLYDYYGFDNEMYKLQFHSKGSRAVAQRVVDLFTQASMPARLTTVDEPRGLDGSPFRTGGSNPFGMRGRGVQAPGLDHGVFVPFRLMFGEDMGVWKDVPVVEVSFDESLDPEVNWQVGKAVSKLREEGYLVLSGGLTVHNLREFTSFNPQTARQVHRDFDNAIFEALAVSDAAERKKALKALTSHPGFRACHPREDHFIPIYVAAGAGEDGDVRVLCDLYGAATVAFGV